jgi:transposase
MAGLAQRLTAAQHGAWLVRALALRRRARPSALRALPTGSRVGGTRRQPHRRYRGQPERQERRKRGRHIDPIGYDAAKKVKGKKRHIIVDTLGLMLGLDVTPADVQDRDGFLPLLKSVRRMFVFLERLFADGAYSGTKTAAAAKRTGKVVLEIAHRSDTANGFVVVAKRWIVERTFGWLGRCRRLAKDVENLTRTQLALVQLAVIRLMTRRIARLCQSS